MTHMMMAMSYTCTFFMCNWIRFYITAEKLLPGLPLLGVDDLCSDSDSDSSDSAAPDGQEENRMSERKQQKKNEGND